MREYEMVHEIKNLCRNNQMRDIFFEDVETDDPVEYVRSRLKGEQIEISADRRADGTVLIHAVCDGLIQSFSFTPV